MEDPAQQGEPCFVVGDGFSGVDNCDIGLICWEPSDENQGHCAAHCDGSPEAPTCATGLACVPSDAALECDQRRFNCCEPYCDTSLPNTCPGQDQTCVPWYVDPDDPPPGLESLGICSLP